MSNNHLINTIILCGGKINYLNLPVSSNTNNSMIPVNGKPVISWLIEDLIKKNVTQAIIVLRAENQHLKDFISKAFKNKIDLNIVELFDSQSILQSLHSGLQFANDNLPTQVILGDTLIKDNFETIDSDYVYVHEVEDSSRWCIAASDENNNITKFYDKEANVPLPHHALCGYYLFTQTTLLKQQLILCSQNNQKQMSDVLLAYQNYQPISIKEANEWFDFGNIDNLIQAKQSLLQSRYFNSLSVDPVLNTITKISEFDQKLRDELNWYKLLPNKLKVLSPRIISEQEIDGKLNLVQEYYGYPTLAELYLFSDMDTDHWRSIFKRLLTLHKTFEQYPQTLNHESLNEIYLLKTYKRVATLCENSYWNELFNKSEIKYNNITYKSFSSLKPQLELAIAALIKNTKGCVIHGDFCFSNILYDLNNQIIRMIDPRGSFGERGVYGDPRYDMAKLRHSIAGLYDYIVSDLFEINETENGFDGEIFADKSHLQFSQEFDTVLGNFGYKPKEIALIEGLLFISMLPLHQDKPNRQKMMFIKGIELLNQTLCV